MIALIDIGNSRVKLGWLNTASGAREAVPLALDGDDLASGIAHWLAQLPAKPTHALGVCVGASLRKQRVVAAFAEAGCPVIWQQARASAMGLINGYSVPEQLGADRWAALLGLLTHLPPDHGPVILANFGTATTIDTLTPEQQFIGGLILPGPTMMLDALALRTAGLPRLDADVVAKVVANTVATPRTTREAIASGVAAAQAGALLRQWLPGLQRGNHVPEVVVTGGGWPLVADEVRRLLADVAKLHGLATPVVHEYTHLVLDGLAALAVPPTTTSTLAP